MNADKRWTPKKALKAWYILGLVALTLCGYAAFELLKRGDNDQAAVAVALICFAMPLAGWLAWSDAKRLWLGLPVDGLRYAILPATLAALYAGGMYSLFYLLR